MLFYRLSVALLRHPRGFAIRAVTTSAFFGGAQINTKVRSLYQFGQSGIKNTHVSATSYNSVSIFYFTVLFLLKILENLPGVLPLGDSPMPSKTGTTITFTDIYRAP